MADLDDLGYISISDMQTDEALEVLRQIRLSRRISTKPTKAAITRKASKAIPKLDDAQAAEILKLLTGEK